MSKDSIAKTFQRAQSTELHPQEEEDEFPPPPTWPVLKAPALRGLAGEFVHTVCEHSEADPNAVLATLLTAFGAALGPKVSLWVGDTQHFPRLYTVIVGNSAKARKGTSAAPIRRMLKCANDLECMRGLQVSDGPCSSAEGLIYAVRDAGDKDDGVNDKRLLIFEGEFGSALRVMKREGNTLSPALRSLWDHGSQKPLTKNSLIGTTGAHISIVGHITEQELGQYLQATDIWNGLANRLVFVCARRAKLTPFPAQTDQHVLTELAHRIGKCVKFGQDMCQVNFDDDAKELWTDIYPEISRDRPGVLGVVTARAEAQIMRLAMLYALLDDSSFVKESHLESALAFWNFSMQSAAHIFGDPMPNGDQQKILTALRQGPLAQSAISSQVFNRNLSAETLRKHLGSLESNGKIHRKTEKTAGAVKTIWSLNEPTSFISLT